MQQGEQPDLIFVTNPNRPRPYSLLETTPEASASTYIASI
jgi:hypothetical protein